MRVIQIQRANVEYLTGSNIFYRLCVDGYTYTFKSRRLFQNKIKRRKKTPTVALPAERYKEKRGIVKITSGLDNSNVKTGQ